tara:strand:+ start:28211 stop:29872 length:1662 start_codon:yes stop_codon:yes gene_type:complete
MNTYKLTKNRITFNFRYNKDIIKDIKLLFNDIKFDSTSKLWHCPNNQFNIDRLEYMSNMYNFIEEGHEADKYPWEELKKISLVNQEQIDFVRMAVDNFGFNMKPRDYQVYGVTAMLDTKCCLNGDDMGLGKTGQAIVSIEIGELKPAIVITPASVKYNWEKEWNKWVDNPNISIIDSKNKNFNAEIVIINYDILKKHITELKKISWKSMTLDESQFIKNSKSQRSTAVRHLAKKIEYKFLLSGTAIMNRIEEIQHPLKILGYFDTEFGGWKKFIFRYCDAHYGGFGLDTSGASNVLELNHKLRNLCYIRREKSDVLKDMPNRVDQKVEVPFTRRRDILSAAEDIVTYTLRQKGVEAAERAERAIPLVTSTTLKEINIDGKLKGIKNWIKDYTESTNDKLLIFGCSSKSLNILSQDFKSPIVDGSVSSKNKFNIVQEFMKSDIQLLFGNIQSLGTGVDGLQEVCSHVLFIDLPDVPTLIEQAVARLHRSGQKKSVNVYYAMSNGGICDIMWDVLSEKYEVTEALNKGDSSRMLESKQSRDMNTQIYNRIRNGEF